MSSSIRENFLQLQQEVADLEKLAERTPGSITCVAVTKTRSVDEITAAYDAGCRDVGENRVQELLSKVDETAEDLRWHLIGTLQRNKVRQIIEKVHLIHSVDSVKLAEEINRCSKERGAKTSILLQVNTSGEESKHGFTTEGCIDCCPEVLQMQHMSVEGLMTMAPLTDDELAIRNTFRTLRDLRDRLQDDYSTELPHLSMGMSHDYRFAIDEGATIIRIGSKIFE